MERGMQVIWHCFSLWKTLANFKKATMLSAVVSEMLVEKHRLAFAQYSQTTFLFSFVANFVKRGGGARHLSRKLKNACICLYCVRAGNFNPVAAHTKVRREINQFEFH